MRRLGLLLLALCWWVALPARADQPPGLHGLPALNVAALAASESHLYVGGFDSGLYVVERGGKTRRFEHVALSAHINALLWSPGERALWAGTARGLTRCEVTTRVCRRVGSAAAVHALLLARDGVVIAGGDAGVTFVVAGEPLHLGKKGTAPFRSVWALAQAPDGTLFVGATNGLFWTRETERTRGGASWQRASVVTGELPDDWVTALLLHDGQLHVGTYNAGVVSFLVADGGLRVASAEREAGYINPSGLVVLESGALAIASMDGLRLGRAGHTVPHRTRGRDVTALVPAWTGGYYWLGTRQGVELMRF